MATLCCGRLGDTDQQGVLQVRERFSELERSYSKPKSKNTEFMMEVESVSALQLCHVRVCQSAPTPLHSARRSRVVELSASCVPVCVLELNACVLLCPSLSTHWPVQQYRHVLVVPPPLPSPPRSCVVSCEQVDSPHARVPKTVQEWR